MKRVRLYVDGILDSTMVTQGKPLTRARAPILSLGRPDFSGFTRTNDLPMYIGGAPYSEEVCDLPVLVDELRVYSIVSPDR